MVRDKRSMDRGTVFCRRQKVSEAIMSRYNGKTETSTQEAIKERILECLPEKVELLERNLGYPKLLTNTAITDLLRDKKILLDTESGWLRKATK